MSKSRRGSKKQGGGYKQQQLLIIVIVLAVAMAIFLFWTDKVETREAAELRVVNEKNKAEEEIKEEQRREAEKNIQDMAAKYMPGIVCWGDSLTAGAGGNGTTYPQVLGETIEKKIFLNTGITCPVVNMGVGGEGTKSISLRAGAIPFFVAEDFTIPAEISPVEIKFETEDGNGASLLKQGNSGMEWVIINGITGVITIVQDSYLSPTKAYYFTRSKVGEKVEAKKGTKITTSGSEMYQDYISVLFIGQNGGWENNEDLIKQQRAIIETHEKNKTRFIIVGLTSTSEEVGADLEKAMEEEYGRQYINLREYLSSDGVYDAGLEPSKKDLKDMKKGVVPEILRVDEVHFNADGYRMIGEVIYQRMEELEYFRECKEAIERGLKFL